MSCEWVAGWFTQGEYIAGRVERCRVAWVGVSRILLEMRPT